MIARSTIAAYGVALAAVAAAMLARSLLDAVLGDRVPFVTLFLAVVFAAWHGGRGPGLLALVAGAFGASYLLLDSGHGFAVPPLEYQTGLFLYTAVGLASIYMIESLQKARQQASEKTELLRTTLASIGDGVITTDAAGRITRMNAVAESLTGWSVDNATGQPLEAVFRIVNEQTRQPVANPATRALREGVIVGLANHTVLIAKDGTERPIDDSAAPIRRDDGALIGCVLVFRDVTDRRRSEEQITERLAAARLLASIVESSEDAIITKSLGGIIESWNAAAQRLFGYTKEQAVGRSVSMLIPADRLGEEEQILASIRAGERVAPFETVRLRSDGQPVHVSLTVSPVKDEAGRIIGASKIVRDITEQRMAQEALVRSERELADFFENAAMGLHWVGPDGTILRVNQKELELLGYSREEYVGHHIAEFHADQDVIADILQRLTKAETLSNYEARLRCKDGSTRNVLINSNVLWEGGGFIHTRCFTRDITEQKITEDALRKSEERLRLAQAAARIGTFEWNIQTGVNSWTPELEAMYGLEPGEFGGTLQSWEQLVHPADREAALRSVNESVGEGRFEGEWRVIWPDGTVRWLAARAWVFNDANGKALRMIGVNIDVTERRNAEDALRESDRRKDEFLATLAHELRNPLAPVKNALELMKRASSNGELVEQARATMERQIGQMVRLIDDLLDVSRITSNKLELKTQWVELASVVHHAVEACRPDFERADHELSVVLPPEPIYLRADPVRLAQVLGNLLTNAGKFTEPGGRIWLTVERQSRDVAVKVKDSGIGIPPEMLPRVFDLFTQVDRSLERSEGGLGIGLSLVKRLVEMHGGAVTAQSEGRGRGSEFVVRLPILTEQRIIQRDPTGETIPTRGRRILIVDDNEDAADSLAMLLRLPGNDTQTAHDGVEAVEASAAFRPDIILLDIGLPKMNGYEACRSIREKAWGKDIVIIALTGWGQEEDRRKSKEAGFDGHLVKPVDYAALMKLIASLCPTSVVS